MQHMLILGLAFLLVGCADTQLADKTSSPAPSPIQGYWISPGTKNIQGAGMDSLLKIQKDSEGLSIVRVLVHHPSVNDRQPPTIQTNGPFRVVLGTNSMSFVESGKKQEYTVRIENNELVMPAFVPVNERTWRFKSPHREGIFQCEFNPETKSSGEATFPSVQWNGIKQSYLTLAEADSRRIQFQVEMKDGRLNTECSLVWDKYGSPRLDGSSWYHDFREERFYPLSQEEFEKTIGMSNKPDAGDGR